MIRSGFSSIAASTDDEIAPFLSVVRGPAKFELSECDSLGDKEKVISHQLQAGSYSFTCIGLSHGKFSFVLKIFNEKNGVILHAEGDISNSTQKKFTKNFTIEQGQEPVSFELKLNSKARFWQKACYDIKLVRKEEVPPPSLLLGNNKVKIYRVKLYCDERCNNYNISTAKSFIELRSDLESMFGERKLKYIDDEGDVVSITTQEDLNSYFEYVELALAKHKEYRPKILLEAPNHPMRSSEVLNLLHWNGTPTPLTPSNPMDAFPAALPGIQNIPVSPSAAMKAPNSRKEIKNWQSIKKIGGGANGTVYLGMNLDNSEFIAIKKVELRSHDTTLKMLEEEISIMAKLSHKNIVHYFGSEKKHGAFYIFLEYIPGGSIEALVNSFHLPEKLVRNYVEQILQGLSYLHNNNVVHCDIKGANILVDEYGRVCLADFGCSKEVGNVAGRQLSGTPNYMAPEVINSIQYTKEGDIWSLGCTLLEMLTGDAPWHEDITNFDNEYAVLNFIRTTEKIPNIPKDISIEAKDFLYKCFEKDPAKRPSAAELLKHPFITSADFTYETDSEAKEMPQKVENNETEDDYNDDGFTFDHIDQNAVLSSDEEELEEDSRPKVKSITPVNAATVSSPTEESIKNAYARKGKSNDENSSSEEESDEELLENVDLEGVVKEVKDIELKKGIENIPSKQKDVLELDLLKSNSALLAEVGGKHEQVIKKSNNNSTNTSNTTVPTQRSRRDSNIVRQETKIKFFLRQNAKEQITSLSTIVGQLGHFGQISASEDKL
jgi:serine/threonine protein kinase